MTRSDTVVNVPLKDVLAALHALHHEFPFNEELCHRAVWRRIEPWHYLCEQQAKIQHHNENLMAIQPIKDALYIFLNKIAKILDHPMMSLGDFLEIHRISRLPPDTPAEEIIRARGRLFNDNMLRKGAIYMAALKAEYYQNTSIISSLSDVWLGLLEGLHKLDHLVSHCQWSMDLHVLHQLELNPMPIPHDEEYTKLRILGDMFEAFGDVMVHDLIDQVFRLLESGKHSGLESTLSNGNE
ncbi:hypothetical protein C8J57DRAFT_1508658 [Mycena rebaudengoi]|nr:hypothetical protein C8J57DRAFT_1508658 [Mycena rebaudengoi]